MICVDIVMFFSGFIHQDDSFKSKIAMFNNSGANIAKEPPADPFQTEDPFKSFNGQNDFHIFCDCCPLGLRLLSATLDVFLLLILTCIRCIVALNWSFLAGGLEVIFYPLSLLSGLLL